MYRILVVEDNDSTITEVLDWLYQDGYGAIGATTGQRGLVLAQRLRPDLILCNIHMPDLDGFSVLQEVRADQHLRQTPFIFVSGEMEPETVRRGRQLGADDHLFQPFTQTQILATVRKHLPRPHSSFPLSSD